MSQGSPEPQRPVKCGQQRSEDVGWMLTLPSPVPTPPWGMGPDGHIPSLGLSVSISVLHRGRGGVSELPSSPKILCTETDLDVVFAVWSF